MPRLAMVAMLAALTTADALPPQQQVAPPDFACSGLPISLFESRFPTTIKRLTFGDGMLETFVDLWKAGSRPELPSRPERVVVYALPGLPLIIGYQEKHCVIAYLAIDSAVLWRWLRHHLGWKA